MCGIAGIINFRGKEDKQDLLTRMLGFLQHRGPDAAGIYARGPAGLGHARLSIIDLSGGDQPIHNEDRTIWIVYNGEVFNYPELRRELEAAGHRFYTQTDTEVLVHLYEDVGTRMFGKLNGQFALALWDEKTQKLLLARDRVGIRPLFYHPQPGRLAFASEIKSIFADPDIPRRIDRQTLADIFTCWAPIRGESAFEDVKQIPPGHYAEFNTNGLSIFPYWSLCPSGDTADLRTLEDCADELEALLLDATRIRLRADVPVGAYLSGGLDSTLTTSLIKRHFNNHLSTFSVAFTDKAFDESPYQKKALETLGTDHRTVLCSEDAISRCFPDVVWHAETPMLRTAPAPMFQLSGLVKDADFKVVLTGEGADEILAGYNIFREMNIRRHWARQPESKVRPRLLEKLYPYIFQGRNEKAKAYLQNFYRQDLTELSSPVYSHLLRWRNTTRIRQFLVSENDNADNHWVAGLTDRFLATAPDDFASWHPLTKAQFTEMELFMSNYLLSTQGDRMAMAHSIEGRYPFLDYRIIEFAFNLPERFRLNGLTEKFILKKAAEGIVPDTIVQRPKQPYRAPISGAFFCQNPPDYVLELLSDRSIRNVGCFDPKRAGNLLKKCLLHGNMLPGEQDNMALAGILSTQLLHDQYILNFPPAPPSGIPQFSVFYVDDSARS